MTGPYGIPHTSRTRRKTETRYVRRIGSSTRRYEAGRRLADGRLSASLRFYAASGVGVASAAASIWAAIGPFGVTSVGGTFGCGSPFLSRYIGVAGDPEAPLAYVCLQQAPARRALAFSLAGVAILCCLLGIFMSRRLASDPSGTPEHPFVSGLLFLLDGLAAVAGIGVVAVGTIAIALA